MKSAISRLQPEQEEQFREMGYCIVDGIFSKKELGEIECFFEEYKRSGNKVFDGNKAYEEIDITKCQLRAMQPHRFSKKVMEWFLHCGVIAVLESLLGQSPLGAQTMYYFKPPGAKGQGMHQDNFYLLAAPATCIAAWTAIDAADIDNGCLWVVPKSHKKPILCPESGGERWMNYGDSHITNFPRDEKPIAVPVPRGSTVFFSGNLIHGSGPNRTKDRSRRTFIGHYINETSEQISRFYHPVLNAQGEVVSNLRIPVGGGPCGDGWQGSTH